jgi:carbonic anhydrase
MSQTTLRALLERNACHTDSLPRDHFGAVQEGQEPAMVSVCCADSRVSQAGMWNVDEPGWLFTPSTIGGQVWDCVDGELVVDGSVLYPIVQTETELAAVVGHTGCGAITAALDLVRGGTSNAPPGVAKWLDLLVPVVEDGLEDDRVDPGRECSLVDQLVEYNVDRQIQFLQDSEDIPDEQTLYGFVYDFQGVYGDTSGRAYLINAEGETDVETLRELVPAARVDHVHRLL